MPGCSNTEKTRGKSGEKKILICSKCGTEGIVLFPKIGGKNNVTEVTVLSRRKKIALASLAIIFLITISFIVIPASNGSLHFLTVLSGSMEPAIHAGDVVVSSEVNINSIQNGDIITFRYHDEKDPNKCITHRVSEITKDENGVKFKTKGDANEESDMRLVGSSEIIGKVVIVLPYLGYLGNFARSIWGFVLFIVIPAFLIIINEIVRIFRIQKGKSKKRI